MLSSKEAIQTYFILIFNFTFIQYTLVNVDHAFACVARCPDSLIRYAVDVTFVQLQFTALSCESFVTSSSESEKKRLTTLHLSFQREVSLTMIHPS